MYLIQVYRKNYPRESTNNHEDTRASDVLLTQGYSYHSFLLQLNDSVPSVDNEGRGLTSSAASWKKHHSHYFAQTCNFLQNLYSLSLMIF